VRRSGDKARTSHSCTPKEAYHPMTSGIGQLPDSLSTASCYPDHGLTSTHQSPIDGMKSEQHHLPRFQSNSDAGSEISGQVKPERGRNAAAKTPKHESLVHLYPVSTSYTGSWYHVARLTATSLPQTNPHDESEPVVKLEFHASAMIQDSVM
jgi:hypothetical protein